MSPLSRPGSGPPPCGGGPAALSSLRTGRLTARSRSPQRPSAISARVHRLMTWLASILPCSSRASSCCSSAVSSSTACSASPGLDDDAGFAAPSRHRRRRRARRRQPSCRRRARRVASAQRLRPRCGVGRHRAVARDAAASASTISASAAERREDLPPQPRRAQSRRRRVFGGDRDAHARGELLPEERRRFRHARPRCASRSTLAEPRELRARQLAHVVERAPAASGVERAFDGVDEFVRR